MAGFIDIYCPRCRKIVQPLSALDDDPRFVCPGCGQEFDFTSARMRQIEAKALRQLRDPERARRLRALMAAR
jgi:RNA polymerase primary sigma factor